MFEKYVESSKFTCKYEFRPGGRLFFGMKCVTSMQSKVDEVLNQQKDKSQAKREAICGEICLEQKSHQPSYDEFSLITIVKFQNCTAQSHMEIRNIRYSDTS